MKYIELTVHTSSEASELVADAFWNYTQGGVAVSDIADVIALQEGKTGIFWDYIDENVRQGSSDVLVKGFFSPDEEGNIARLLDDLARMKERAGEDLPFGTLEATRREIDGDDWIDIWKKHFRPIRLGRIVVVPEWIGYRKEEGEETVTLDAGMAFGTGEHETTSMCLELLQDYLKAGDAVLDVGCGSGILGIAAAKLGAERCYLSDLDPIAVASAEHNARSSGVSEKVTVTQADLLEGSSLKADLILANITAEILVKLAPAVPSHLNEGGTVILSGILLDRIGLVKTAFGKEGLSVAEERRRGDWAALVFKK